MNDAAGIALVAADVKRPSAAPERSRSRRLDRFTHRCGGTFVGGASGARARLFGRGLRRTVALLFCSAAVQIWSQDDARWGQVRIEKDDQGRPVAMIENNRIRLRWAHGGEAPAQFALREIALTRPDGSIATIAGAIDFPGEARELGYVRIAADLPDRKSILVGWRRESSERAPSIRRI